MGGVRNRGKIKWRVDTLSEVAEFFGVSTDTVRHWRGDGMPGVARKWDLAAIARWRIGRAEKRIVKSAPRADGEGYADPRDREKHWKAEIARLEYETRIGKNVPRETYEHDLAARCGWFQQVISLLGAQLAPLVAHQSVRQCRRIIDKHGRAILKAAFGERKGRI